MLYLEYRPQPSLQLQHHLGVVREAVVDAETMLTYGIDMHHSWHAFLTQGGIVAGAIEWWHGSVIGCEHDEGLRSLLGHLQLVAVEAHHFVRWILSEQVLTRALMGKRGIHGDHRIEEDLEGWAHIVGSMSGYGAGQVASGRRTHHTYLVRVDVQLLGMGLEVADASIHIASRYQVVAMRHAVVQQHGSDALAFEEIAPGIAFVVDGCHHVAATWANNYHGHGLVALRHEDLTLWCCFYGIGRQVVVIHAVLWQGAIAPQVNLCAA